MGKREPGRGSAAVVACLVLLAGQAGAAGREGDGPAGGRQSGERIVLDPSPGGRAVEPLLARLWDSGFFRRNEAVRVELLNNKYAFFDATAPVAPEGSSGLGCYSQGAGGGGTIFLRKDLLAWFEVGMDGVQIYPSMMGRVLPVLVHEICHDLWMNILDPRERAAFAREGCDFLEEYRRAQTTEEKRLFLREAGDDPDDPRCLRSYAGLEAILTACPARTLRAHELFAFLAERLFVKKAMIPMPLQKYYSCILAEVRPGLAEIPR